MDYSGITKVVIDLVATLIVLYVVPALKKFIVSAADYLDGKYGDGATATIAGVVRDLVQSAEQKYTSGVLDGDDRKQYVIDGLEQLGYEITDLIDALIESKVYELNQKQLEDEILAESLITVPVFDSTEEGAVTETHMGDDEE